MEIAIFEKNQNFLSVLLFDASTRSHVHNEIVENLVNEQQLLKKCVFTCLPKPEDHWSCIAHRSAEDMLKSAVIGEKRFKHSPRVGADNPLGPIF